jgi:hypothetical protein
MKEVEEFYQSRAKEFVDELFDKGYFREDVSRDGINDVENLLAFLFQQYCESAKRCALLVKRVKENKEAK